MGSGSWSNSFRHTTGSNHPISKKGDIRYDKKKTEAYLLNLDHPVGGAKAKFFKDVLGYTKDDSKLFHKNIAESLIGKIPVSTEETKFGLKHTFNVSLKGKNGTYKNANVVVVTQKDNDRKTYKIVTVYPRKENE